MKTENQIQQQVDYQSQCINPEEVCCEEVPPVVTARLQSLEWVLGDGPDPLYGGRSSGVKHEAEIRQMIADLEEHKKTLPPKWATLGGGKWVSIEAQIETLRWVLD